MKRNRSTPVLRLLPDDSKELPYAQWICGPDAERGHFCECSESEEECACTRHALVLGEVRCVACGEVLTAIDFASGEAASDAQRSALLTELGLGAASLN